MTVFQDAFISYGRADSKAFAIELHQRLMAAGFTVWFDFEDIPLGVDYQKQIDDGIEKADNVLFIISPHSVNSPYCDLEVERALKRGKRIIPLLHVEQISRATWQERTPDGTDEQWAAYQAAGKHSSYANMHPAIGKINWVYLREGIDDFEAGLQGLLDIFARQQGYVRQHTELLAAALSWEQNQKRTQYLLTGQARQQAEDWLQVRFPKGQLPCVPTDLHCEYITESIKNAHNLMAQVFLAHAEADTSVVQQIRRALQREGITVWTSATDIRTGEDFQQAINRGIEQADNLVYLLSPAAIASAFCQQELDYALSMHKRIIPVLVGETDAATMPEALQRLQYIEWLAAETAENASRNRPLLKALKDDAAYFNEHKVLLTQALKWERQQRSPSILLRGYNLRHAEAWLKVAQTRARHQPTVLQTEFLQESLRQPPAPSLDVFISYSRVDSDFARQLNDRLQMQGKLTWFDQESIASGADFQQEIYRGIETSDHFLFILSPEAVNSPYCADEVDYAQTLNKRVVTVRYRPVDTADLHPVLAAVQWIDFCQGEGDFNANFKELLRTLETDRAHLEAHTRLMVKALEWDKKQRRSDLLLRGDEFVIAENWLVEAFHQQKQPLPTPLHKDYIQAGREAQEREVKREKRRILVLRSLLAVMSLAFVAASGAGIYAYRLWRSGEIAQIESLAKQSNAEFLAGQNTDALVTALEAGHRWEKYPESDRALVHQVLQQAVSGIREVKTLGDHDGAVREVVISPDGTIIASGTSRGEIKLWNQDGKLLHTFSAHDSGYDIRRLVFGPDGEVLASASEDETAKLWNLKGELLHTFADHDDKVWDIAFSPDGQTLATSSHDATLKLWSRNGELLKTLNGHEDRVWGLVLSPDGQIIASHSDDATLKLWNWQGELIQTLSGHTVNPRSKAFSPDGALIASSGADKTVRLWDRSGELLSTLTGHEDIVSQVTFSPDGQLLASASHDYTIKLWTRGGQFVETLTGHTSGINWVMFSQDGQTLISSSNDGSIKQWNLDGTLLQTFTGHQGWVVDLALSPDGQTLLSASGDKTLRLWGFEGNTSTTLKGHKSRVFDPKFSPDGSIVLTGESYGQLKLWTTNGELIRTVDAYDIRHRLSDFEFSPDGQVIASISRSGPVAQLWNAEGKLLKVLEGHEGESTSFVAFSPDGKILATTRNDIIRLWNLDGELLHTLTNDADYISKIAFSPDSKILASANGTDGTVKLWSTEGELLHTLGNRGEYTDLVFSPDGQYLAAANADNTLQLWSTNGELIRSLEDHTGSLVRVRFTPDSQTIGSTSLDGTTRLWTLDGELLQIFGSSDERMGRFAFSPDGKFMATESENVDNHTIKLWSIEGELLQTLVGHQDWTLGLAFSPDGKTLASSSADETAILWNLEALEFDALMQRGCEWWREYTEYQDSPPDRQQEICQDV
ncbi:MAG: TIR domain-containing protein [Cyanobacteria bacterium P01_A01_bin.15]